MTIKQQAWLRDTAAQARTAGHIFPEMAACEAGLESNFGQSTLAREGLNLFGTKQHSHPIHGTLNLPTKEFEHGEWVPEIAAWVKYDNLQECFADRMATVTRLSTAKDKNGELAYPGYAACLIASDAYTYVTNVSQNWSTDPNRAAKCIAIYGEYFRFQPQSAIDEADA